MVMVNYTRKMVSAYFTEKGAFRHHPCTIWANESTINAWWLLAHGLALCNAEYTHRYSKEHSCEKTLSGSNKNIYLPQSIRTNQLRLCLRDLINLSMIKLLTSLLLIQKIHCFQTLGINKLSS